MKSGLMFQVSALSPIKLSFALHRPKMKPIPVFKNTFAVYKDISTIPNFIRPL